MGAGQSCRSGLDIIAVTACIGRLPFGLMEQRRTRIGCSKIADHNHMLTAFLGPWCRNPAGSAWPGRTWVALLEAELAQPGLQVLQREAVQLASNLICLQQRL